MGGVNTQTQQPTQSVDSINPAVSGEEEATYARIKKQGMSGGDESLASYIGMGKDIYGGLKQSALNLIKSNTSPNSYTRESSAPATPDSTIKK